MEIYQKAYDCYRAACKNYGMESVNIYQFVKQLTQEQLDAYLEQAVH